MKRMFDFTMAILLLIIFSLPMLIIALLVKLTSKGPILYWSDRVGKNNVIFNRSFVFDLKTLFMTIFNVLGSKGVEH